MLNYGVISPQDWGLAPVLEPLDTVHEALGISLAEVEQRAKMSTEQWLRRQFDEQSGAFFGFYRAPQQEHEPPQTTNLIAPWQMMTAYDRYGDQTYIDMAERAAAWFYEQHVITHPMSVVAGGVRDGLATDEVWTKFAAEETLTCLGLHTRTGKPIWRDRAEQCGRYLIQARRHNFAPRYNLRTGLWMAHGWDSWGRVVEAHLMLWQITGAQSWLDEAMQWGYHALAIQQNDGAFYLIDGEYYNTDLAADELRALTMLYEISNREAFLRAARRFADWHIVHQLPNGAWPLTIDLNHNIVIPTVGPGDMPNIGIALLRLYHVSGQSEYLERAVRTIRYTLDIQATPDSTHPYTDDPNVRWGFWSWDPYYDYTLSGDQSTHHARGMWFIVDYLSQ